MIEGMGILLSVTVSGTLLAAILLLLKPLLGHKVPKAFSYYIWILVLVRLVVPFGNELPVSSIVPSAPVVTVNRSLLASEYEDALEEQAEGELLPSGEELAGQEILTGQETMSGQEVLAGQVSASGSATADTDKEEFVAGMNVPVPKRIVIGLEELWVLQLVTMILARIWIAGVIVSLVWHGVSYGVYHRKITRSLRPLKQEDIWAFRDLNGRENRVQVACSNEVDMPMLMGVLRPMIVLPGELYETQGMSDEVRGILRHELIHYYRKDLIYKWAVIAVTSIHWFNPMIYVMRREIWNACELSCDEAVIRSMSREERQQYGNTLLSMAAGHQLRANKMTTTLCEGKKELKNRLVGIMKYQKKGMLAVALMVVLAVVLVGCSGNLLSLGQKSDVVDVINEEVVVRNPVIEEEGVKVELTNVRYEEGWLYADVHAWSDELDDFMAAYPDKGPTDYFKEIRGLSYLTTGDTIFLNRYGGGFGQSTNPEDTTYCHTRIREYLPDWVEEEEFRIWIKGLEEPFLLSAEVPNTEGEAYGAASNYRAHHDLEEMPEAAVYEILDFGNMRVTLYEAEERLCSIVTYEDLTGGEGMRALSYGKDDFEYGIISGKGNKMYFWLGGSNGAGSISTVEMTIKGQVYQMQIPKERHFLECVQIPSDTLPPDIILDNLRIYHYWGTDITEEYTICDDLVQDPATMRPLWKPGAVIFDNEPEESAVEDEDTERKEALLRERCVDIGTLPQLDIDLRQEVHFDDRTLRIEDSLDNELEAVVYELYHHKTSGDFASALQLIAPTSGLVISINNEAEQFMEGRYNQTYTFHELRVLTIDDILDASEESKASIYNKVSLDKVSSYAIVYGDVSWTYNEAMEASAPQLPPGQYDRYWLLVKHAGENSYKIAELFWEDMMALRGAL